MPDRLHNSDSRIGMHAASGTIDSVLVDRRGRIEAVAHTPRTRTLTGDIAAGLTALRRAAPHFDFGSVSAVTLTAPDPTAMATSRRLGRVATLRIGAPLTSAIGPLVTWEPKLRRRVDAGSAFVAGGVEFNGARVAPLDERAIAEFANVIARQADAVAITSVFSPVNPSDEITAAQIITSVAGSVPITLSHEISTLGLVERENATIMNAALRWWAARPAREFRAAVASSEMPGAECYFTQNDGTQRITEYAERFPVFQIGSSTADGVRGAAHCSGLRDAVVVQLSAEVTTITRLVAGFPRESMQRQLLQGVLTRFRIPETITFPAAVDPEVISAALTRVGQRTDNLPLIVVGPVAGALSDHLDSMGLVIRPPHGDVANAVGAAVAPVGGSAERICQGRPETVESAVDELTATARNRAILAGAAPDSLHVIDAEKVPLTYLREPAVHIRVRVVGMPMG